MRKTLTALLAVAVFVGGAQAAMADGPPNGTSDLCAAVLQQGQQVLQYAPAADGDIDYDGTTITIAPEATTTCEQRVDQAAAASGGDPAVAAMQAQIDASQAAMAAAVADAMNSLGIG